MTLPYSPAEIEEAGKGTRAEIITEIMKLVRQPMVPMDHKPTITDIEAMLNSESAPPIYINPDGSVSVEPPPATVGDVADVVMRIIRKRHKALLATIDALQATVEEAQEAERTGLERAAEWHDARAKAGLRHLRAFHTGSAQAIRALIK